MDDARAPLHVVVLPWLAFAHLLSFLELSKSLARHGHRVSFLSTPRNLQRLPSVPPALSHLITLVGLPFPSAGTTLPAGAEATSDVHAADNGHLKAASDALEAPFAAFLQSTSPPPDWVVHDFTAHWMPRVAAPRRLPCAFFSVFLPSSMAFYGPPAELLGCVPGTGRLWKRPEDLTVPPPWTAVARHSSTLAYRLHEARRFLFPFFSRGNASGVSDAQRMGLTLEAVQVVVVRSCPEVDGDWIRLLGELYNKPVVPVGFLPPPTMQEGADKAAATSSVDDAFEWLDRQAPSSVLFVALGSEAALSVDLLHELARGLELSQLPFLWALRQPAGGLPPDVELLPEGFEARTAGRGMVIKKGWIPQPEIHAHPAVGGFLTHCGWSSLVQALCHGRPLVMLPVLADQALNARLMGARGLGIEVPRRGDDGAFTREGVAEAARLVVVDETGAAVRTAARRAAEVFGARGLNQRYENELARYLVDHRN